MFRRINSRNIRQSLKNDSNLKPHFAGHIFSFDSTGKSKLAFGGKTFSFHQITMNNRKNQIIRNQKGFGLIEIVIVLLILAIIVVLALPQIISSRRLFRFSGLQRQVAATLRDTRQEAITQRTAVTFRYDNTEKRMIVYGGKFGAFGDAKNPIMPMSGDGLVAEEIGYGRPTGAPVSALGDSSNMTDLTDSAVEVQFQPDGSVVNASDIPQNKALFFYNPKTPADTSFAVSVLGAGGRVKIWRYSSGAGAYVE